MSLLICARVVGMLPCVALHVQPVTCYTVGGRCLVAVWKQYADQIICSSVNALALLLPRRLKLKEKQNHIWHDCREHRRVARWTEATSAACFQSYG